jgi:hypothetical protein
MTFLFTVLIGGFLLWQAVCLVVLGFAKFFDKLDQRRNRRFREQQAQRLRHGCIN